MADKGWLFAKKAELLELEAKLEGMKAHNIQRVAVKDYVGIYSEECFQEISRECASLSYDIMINR